MWKTREPYRGDSDNSHTSLDLRESMTDLQKLLNNSDPLKSAMRRFEEQEALLKDESFSAPAAYLDQQKELARTLSGDAMTEIARLSSGSLSEQMRRDVLSCAYMPSSTSETLAEMIKKEFKSDADVLAWLKAADPTASLAGPIDFKEMERLAKERQLNEMVQSSMEHNQHIIRQAAEVRKQQKDTVEYARRSAEATEAALEVERQRTVAALKTAAEARDDARIARRNMRISLWFAGGTLLLAAWPFIKDRF